MYTEKFKNNKVEIMGKVTKSLTFSHELCGESFYESEITVSRLSGVEAKSQFLYLTELLISAKIIREKRYSLQESSALSMLKVES